MGIKIIFKNSYILDIKKNKNNFTEGLSLILNTKETISEQSIFLLLLSKKYLFLSYIRH
jgi:hypothetical protein